MEQKPTKIELADQGPAFGVRHVQILYIFVLAIVMYATRFSFSVALVAMTNNHSSNAEVPVYNWTNKGVLLSTFFWGYVIPQLPIGILGTKFGTKYFILIAVLLNSLFSLLIPTLANKFDIHGVAVCRVVQGFSQSLVIPSFHGLLGKWAPTNERSRMYGVLIAGYTIGTVLGLTSTGFICGSSLGWPWSFYPMPAVGFVWVILYFFYGAPSPAAHKTISEAERTYIETSLNSQNTRNVSIPFKAILTSVPFLSTVFMALCSGWGFAIFSTELPIYMDKIMHFNIDTNGILSSLPHICYICTSLGVAVVADFFISRHYFSVGTTRKIMSAIGSLGAALLLLIVAYIPSSYRYVAVAVLVLASAFRSMNVGGFNVNHLDLAPNFGSTLMGMTNTASEMFSLITPLAVEYIVSDEADQSLWRIMFFIAVGFYVVSTIIFIIFSSGERQWWNYATSSIDEEESFVRHQQEMHNLK